MTESQVRARATAVTTARATARVGGGPTPATGPVSLVPRPRPGHIGPVHVLQFLLVEAAIVAILSGLSRDSITLFTSVVGGSLVLLVTLARRRGRWWFERRLMSWQFRRRVGAAAAVQQGDHRLAAIRSLAPGLTVEDVSAPDGSQIGVAVDDAGWFAVAQLAVETGGHDGVRMLPLDVLVAALAEADPSGRAVVQVITHTVPVPERGGTAGDSYRALIAQHAPASIPVDRVIWIAVRLDARALAEMGAELPEQAPALVGALMRHLIKTIRRSSITARLLDREGLLAALDRSCDLGAPAGSVPRPPREDWKAWHSGRLAHRSYWLADWPPVGRAAELLDALATVPAVLTSIAIILAPSGDRIDIRCLVRIAAAPDRLSAVAAAIRERAHRARAHLLELDGEQGPAVYATAPTGGGPR